jgi:glutamyl-Q tRNA(Asp) synthetase
VSAFATRFAPSPTGLLHRGHAFSALTAWTAAQAVAGRFVLRVEDIDRTRSRPEFEAAIVDDLRWLGLEWETPVRRQSEHMADYGAALERLRGAGLLYRDFRSRRELAEAAASAPHGPERAVSPGPHPPAEETTLLAEGRPFAWRLSMDRAHSVLGPEFNALTLTEDGAGPKDQRRILPARAELAGDVVLARKDVGVAYHLAVVVDDALQGITHVIRGVDLFEATGVQRLLQTLLGLPEPVYRHHPLLVGTDGRRYAKRDRSETLHALRAAGMTAERLRAELGFPPG